MKAPEVTIIGRHTQEFAERDGGEVLKETIHQLQFRINALASKMGIANLIDVNIVICSALMEIMKAKKGSYHV